MKQKILLKKNQMLSNSGFTLIELLIIIAVIAILATIVFVALNPLARFQDARNAKRWSDVTAVLAAIKLHQVDNGGSYLTDIADLSDNDPFMIGTGSACQVVCLAPAITTMDDCVNLDDLISSGHLPVVPLDPNASGSSRDHTYYYLIKHDTGSITVGACNAEKGSNAAIPEIFVTK